MITATVNTMFYIFDGYSSTIDMINKKTEQATKVLLAVSKASEKFNQKLKEMTGKATKASNSIESLNLGLITSNYKFNIVSNSINQFNTKLNNTDAKVTAADGSLGSLKSSLNAVGLSANAASDYIDNLNSNLNSSTVNSSSAKTAIDDLSKKLGDAGKNSDSASSSVSKLLGKFVNLENIQKGLAITDEYTSTSIRLKNLEDQKDLQDKIFASANRSKSAYADMANVIANMGVIDTGNFGSNDELISFAELTQKSIKLGGASSGDQSDSMSIITDAMNSGQLEGDGFSSLMKNAPMIADAISSYTGKSTEELLKMSSEGDLTADVLKNAMFNASDEINTKFLSMPATFGEVGELMQNKLLETFAPVLEMIGNGATWIADNWDNIAPIFTAAAVGVGAFAIALGLMQAATLFADIASKGLNATLMKNPLVLIAALVAVVIGVIYKWAQSVGGFQIAWLIVVDKLLYAWDMVKIGFFAGVYFVLNLLDSFLLGFLIMKVNVLNVVGDLKANVLMMLQNLVNGTIDIINKLIRQLNKIPGVSIDLIDKVSFGTNAALENEAEKQARQQDLANAANKVENDAAQRQADINQMKEAAEAATQKRKKNIADKQAEVLENSKKATEVTIEPYNPSADTGSDGTGTGMTGSDGLGTSGNPMSVEGTGSNGTVGVNMEEEDIEYLRDIAERDFINNFSTATLAPNIQLTFGDVHETADADEVAGRIKAILQEEIATTAEGVYC